MRHVYHPTHMTREEFVGATRPTFVCAKSEQKYTLQLPVPSYQPSVGVHSKRSPDHNIFEIERVAPAEGWVTTNIRSVWHNDLT